MDKVSIVVPVFNSIGTLERCISSIISQTFEQLEIILVDDGSQDGSLSICNKLASEDTRIKVIHQNNAGVSSARNAGIQESTGKWLMFVDSDDWIESNTIEYMIGLMKKEDARTQHSRWLMSMWQQNHFFVLMIIVTHHMM